MIEIQGLKKSFEQRVIFSDLNMKLEKGKIYALIGKSGSGKTTLLNMLAKLEAPDGGRIMYQGQDLSTLSSQVFFRQEMGYLFQHFGLLENQSIRENLDLGFVGQKLSKVERLQRQLVAMEQVNLGYLDMNKPVYTLSGGEAQRVALAKLILKNPPLILADEPTAALDPKNSEEVMQLLTELKNDKRVIVIATHNPAIWEKADVVIDMKEIGHG
ncbi:ABC transporter ATP-binding protein [Streptococcus suis]|uniref:ABC transporter, ATP-binding protein n=1 Tax=Streptococcus suis R61 TaxID=996306 RepID=A0AA87K3B0_STRSU|nr:ABC transporter ATP-binding protein [Streptococcus suis]ATZ04631.1 peptide ABC transporter ATP-binding protein [Streptococcus suis]EHC02192.1 ABC transporter, ATP-binding protein [Streptococcus suis R61]MBY4974452.1 ABC transporter ATP-binding protein [Streptococcus suis]MBY5000519.1 ABC transporter ATP-binding protein [Streptococcus suis]MBY5011531.1 ABC transporter ATP-binding protein [Streptococcus suis]